MTRRGTTTDKEALGFDISRRRNDRMKVQLKAHMGKHNSRELSESKITNVRNIRIWIDQSVANVI